MKMTIWHRLFGLALIGALSLELLGDRTAPVEVWDYPLFFALMGLFGCFILSLVAKGIVSPALDRPEDFYGPEDAEGDWTSQSPAARADARATSPETGTYSDVSAETPGRPGAPTDSSNGGEG